MDEEKRFAVLCRIPILGEIVEVALSLSVDDDFLDRRYLKEFVGRYSVDDSFSFT